MGGHVPVTRKRALKRASDGTSKELANKLTGWAMTWAPPFSITGAAATGLLLCELLCEGRD
jgi:hypothetical protein